MEQYSKELANDIDPVRLEAALFKRDQDIEFAIKELESLINDGSSFAMAALGNIYLYGTHSITRDEQKGERLLARASAMGSIEGAYRLACFLDSRARNAEAFKLYESLAEKGFSPALYRLGWAYHTGRWVDKNTSKAKDFFWRAYRKGHFLAQQKLSYELRKSPSIRDRVLGFYLLASLIAKRKFCHTLDPKSDRLRD